MSDPLLKKNFFTDVLGDNPAALPVRITERLVADCAPRAVVVANRLDFEEYAELGHCELEVEPQPRPDSYCIWGGEDHDRLENTYDQAVWRVLWNDQTLRVVHVEWATGCGNESRDWVVANTADLARAFILEVERKTHHPGESILVFSDGHWQRSRGLYRATQSASFDDLVLAEDLKQTIRDDFRRFLESEEEYNRLGIAWRRGALLVGPPGNGKTHCVRALVKELDVPSLYVQSLAHHYWTPEQLWKHIFDRARGLRPCVLVLEDLDALVNPENRSFFLNQLDGFERNHGLIVLATTNYPERIDQAIINRPSRFDRKYHFSLPSEAERRTFLAGWQARLAEETRWPAEELDALAALTGGFSFAYLKELVISSVMQWMADRSVDFAQVAADQANLLKRQMRADPEANGAGPRWGLFRRRDATATAAEHE